MADTPLDNRPAVASRVDHIFATLTPAQVARIAAHGSVRPIRRGEVLVEEGAKVVPFFVVKEGQIEVVRPARSGGGRFFGAEPMRVALHGPGQFTGEVNMLSGRRSLFRAHVTAPGEV